ncbi:hypothetical protein FQR65_LT07963 [Abscondita terminalis]|nr:hypothetical protein FQR65_LT07963 [Abscondita terminalis]
MFPFAYSQKIVFTCIYKQTCSSDEEFHNSPVVLSPTVNLDHGHINPIANGEFTIFTPLSPPHHNNNVFLANEQIVGRTEIDCNHADIDVNSWFDESERDFPRTKLKYIKEMGRGWFGRVVEGTAQGLIGHQESWTPVAVRILEATATSAERAVFLHDAAIYRCGKHPHILKLLGRSLESVPLLLLQELCPCGDLKKYLRDNQNVAEKLLSSELPLLWACQISSALKFLHDHNLIHPDFAARNCQLVSERVLKLGDYGLAATLYPEDYYQGAPAVPVRWCAPESLIYTSTTIQPKKITIECNVWSLGITLWEIFECGAQPYNNLTDDDVISQVIGTAGVRLAKPKISIIYSDYLFRLMQLCWSTSESRPSVSQVHLMLSELMQVYQNTTKQVTNSEPFSLLQDFDKHWNNLKPNCIVRTDNHDFIQDSKSLADLDLSDITVLNLNKDEELLSSKPMSPSLNNLHGSLDNLSNEELDSWLQKVATNTGDMSYVRGLSEAINDLDNALALENVSSSDSSHQPSPAPENLNKSTSNKLEFQLGPTNKMLDLTDDIKIQNSSLTESMQRTSSGSETEDENWRRKIEDGVYSEKVHQKSKSVTDLMILTHIDYSESDSETPLPSLDYRVNYKNVRYAPKQNLENVSLMFGSEGNLLSVHDKFQEELRKLQEERKDSLLFVPEYSRCNDNDTSKDFGPNLVSVDDAFSSAESGKGNCTYVNTDKFLSSEDDKNDPVSSNTSPSHRNSELLIEELSNTTDIQPANQVYNVFNVTVDTNFNPKHDIVCMEQITAHTPSPVKCFNVPKLTELIQNNDDLINYIINKYETEEEDVNINSNTIDNISQIANKEMNNNVAHLLEENIKSTEELLQNERAVSEDPKPRVEFDTSGTQEELSPNSMTHSGIFTSTPFTTRTLDASASNHTKTVLPFSPNFNESDTSDKSELKYSLETWDNFLGEAMEDPMKCVEFEGFVSEPPSILFVDGEDISGKSLDDHVDSKTLVNKTFALNTDVLTGEDNETFVLNENVRTGDGNGTFVLDENVKSDYDNETVVLNEDVKTGDGNETFVFDENVKTAYNNETVVLNEDVKTDYDNETVVLSENVKTSYDNETVVLNGNIKTGYDNETVVVVENVKIGDDNETLVLNGNVKTGYDNETVVLEGNVITGDDNKTFLLNENVNSGDNNKTFALNGNVKTGDDYKTLVLNENVNTGDNETLVLNGDVKTGYDNETVVLDGNVKTGDDNQTFVLNDNAKTVYDNKTVVLDENVKTGDDNEKVELDEAVGTGINNETIVLNKTYECESAFGPATTQGWFLHPQSNSDVSGQMEASPEKAAESYVGFSVDDEIVAALRNELLMKLPQAQGPSNEDLQESDDWDTQERNEVLIKYNIYTAPLSPIPEESCSEDSHNFVCHRRNSTDSENDEDWPEPYEGSNTPPADTETISVPNFESLVQEQPLNRHTPSQDSCCSNDTLFNLEELTNGANEQDADKKSEEANKTFTLRSDVTQETDVNESKTEEEDDENPLFLDTTGNLLKINDDVVENGISEDSVRDEDEMHNKNVMGEETSTSHLINSNLAETDDKIGPSICLNAECICEIENDLNVDNSKICETSVSTLVDGIDEQNKNENVIKDESVELTDINLFLNCERRNSNLEDKSDASVIKDADAPDYINVDHLNQLKMDMDYVNVNELENFLNINQCDYVNVSKEHDPDIYEALTDIHFTGPSDMQIMSTSFSESVDIDEQDWDSGSDTRSSSSGEFIWKEGEHEESVKALRAAPQEMNSNEKCNTMDDIDEVSSESSEDDEDGDSPEFVPSAWDKYATPTKSALRSPEKTLEKAEIKQKKQKGVWFKKQKYHCVYEYPREPESPAVNSFDLWQPVSIAFADWEVDTSPYIPSLGAASSHMDLDRHSRNLYLGDFSTGMVGLDDEFYISGTAQPFEAYSGFASQFFPGNNASEQWMDLTKPFDNITPDSGVEDITPASSCNDFQFNPQVQTLKTLAGAVLKRTQVNNTKNNNTKDCLGGLRHARNKLKLDLPPSPSAFTVTKVFAIEPEEEPITKQEVPTFTTFGKSRFLVQHVDTPTPDEECKNVSFEALPYKPLHIVRDDKAKVDARGEASLLDSADEDSGIESSTLERRKIATTVDN